ncbi:hypothetical protein LCGC14_1031630 [marine sediment metagenome]|uniref:Uncharacterized protein n=1 Tax=marine sediment metagenome TaxID=412755 RepID=A0A0F9MYY7_9ZZZZ
MILEGEELFDSLRGLLRDLMSDDDKTPEEILIDIAREHPDFYEKYVIKGDSVSTMYGDVFAAVLIDASIPFSVTYELEFQATFHVGAERTHEVYQLLMKLRGSKLR